MDGTISAHWRNAHGTGPELKGWRGAVVWGCPDNCGGELTEGDGGMRCCNCGTVFSYARLAAEQ
jgi:hypothetical protein